MHRRTAFALTLTLMLALLTAGCATILDSAIDSAARKTGETVGDAVGKRIGDAIVRKYTPVFTQWYTSYLFSIAFGAGGYMPMATEQAPGEWTKWVRVGDEKGTWMERARLFDTDEGNQWWRVKYYDGDSQDTVIMEAMFSPDRGQLLRLRSKFPDDEEPQEMPVNENSYYAAPQKLTKESLEGSKVGTDSVTVPAGTFTADHHRFGDAAGGTHEWWLVGSVPGGVVRYAQTSPSGETEEAPEGSEGLDPDDWTLDLAGHGTGAVSELGVE